ncbi:MAG: 30S ribosomal protein S6e [Thermoplasmata archaeon]|nr:30S ribosomal protein S6e [Thermoplasmata archaeon]
MVEFKLVIGDSKTGKSFQKEVKDKEAKAFLGKVIGEKINGNDCGFAGYEFLITGGSDYCGFPMRKDNRGTSRKKILSTKGVGIKTKEKGLKIRKTVAGNTIHDKISQINLKISKAGKKSLMEEEASDKKDE